MTERAQDPRSLRTVTALRTALREVLRDRALDDVSVSEICRLADVRRTTFYTHSSSVPELLTEMLTGEVDDLLGLPDLTAMTIPQAAAGFQDTLVAAFDVVAADRNLFRAAFDSTSSALLRGAFTAVFTSRLELALHIWHGHGVADDVDPAVAVPFAAGGLAAAVEAWADNDGTDATAWAAAVRDQLAPWWPRG